MIESEEFKIAKLEELLERYDQEKKLLRHRLTTVDSSAAAGENPAKAIYQEIRQLYPDYFPKLRQLEIQQAISLLESEGYKVLKRVENVTYEEV